MASSRLRELVREAEDALPLAEGAMVKAAVWLSGRDQNEDLMAAVNKVLDILREEASKERSAETAYLKIRVPLTILEIGLNLMMSFGGSQSPPILDEGDQSPPFGKVLIAVGPEGIPDGISVLNISSKARAENTSESTLEGSLAALGYWLLTREDQDGIAKVSKIGKREPIDSLERTIVKPVKAGG